MMTDEIKEALTKFADIEIARPVFNPQLIVDEHGVNEHMMYGAPIAQYRASVLHKLELCHADMQVVVSTEYGIDAVWKLFWRSAIRFFFKSRAHGRNIANTEHQRGNR